MIGSSCNRPLSLGNSEGINKQSRYSCIGLTVESTSLKGTYRSLNIMQSRYCSKHYNPVDDVSVFSTLFSELLIFLRAGDITLSAILGFCENNAQFLDVKEVNKNASRLTVWQTCRCWTACPQTWNCQRSCHSFNATHCVCEKTRRK